MDKSNTIFEDRRESDQEPFEEKIVNATGSGLEHHTFVAACETPEEKVFWVIAHEHRRRPHLFGTAKDFKEAEETVLAKLNNTRATCRSYQFALEEYLEQIIEEAALKGQNMAFSETSRLEFVYEKYGACKYQIKKKSSSEIEVYGARYHEKFKPDEKTPVFKLNKRELDNKGETKARGQIFCTEARKAQVDKFRKAPSYLQIFGLDWSAEIEDVKYWYRKLSKQYHPDRGGSVKKFRELTESYEKAIQYIHARNERDGFV
ncbi:MAG: DnaJ domain-containing protein [Bacteroidota bacterium]